MFDYKSSVFNTERKQMEENSFLNSYDTVRCDILLHTFFFITYSNSEK